MAHIEEQQSMDLEDPVLEPDGHVEVVDLGLLVPREDEPLGGVGGRLDDRLVGRPAVRARPGVAVAVAHAW